MAGAVVLAGMAAPSGAGAAVVDGDGVAVRFPDRLQDGEVAFRDGKHRIGFALRGARGRVSVKGATATTRNALPGVDVRYDVAGKVLKESLRLSRRGAPSRFVFDVTTSAGVTAVLKPDRSIAVQDRSGRSVMQVTPPFMFDSARPNPALSHAVSVTFRRVAANRYRYAIAADRSWLAAPERVWPVVVDPTVDSMSLIPLGPPRCRIDDHPDPLEPHCAPPPYRESSTFTANTVVLDHRVQMDCVTSIQNANPPADDLSGRAQLRLRLEGCTYTINGHRGRLFSAFLYTRLLTSNGLYQVAASGASCEGHLGHICGGGLDTPLIDVQGLASGEYIQESTIRYILNEDGHPDPWRSPPPGWETPTDTKVPPEPNGQGICAGATTVIRCVRRVPVTIINDRVPTVKPPSTNVCDNPKIEQLLYAICRPYVG